MAGLLSSALLKLRRRPATLVVLLVLVGLLALVFLGVGASAGQVSSMEARLQMRLLLAFPNAYLVVVGIILAFGGLLAVAYGAAVSGAEWAWGTIRPVVARGESRPRYVLVLFAAVAILLVIGVLAAFAAGAVMAVVAAGMAGVDSGSATDPDTLGTLPDLLARTWLGVTEQAAIGFAIAMLFRSQLAGMVAGLAFYFGEAFLGLVPIVQDWLPYFPFNVAQAVVASAEGFSGQGGPSVVGRLDSTTALALAIAYLVLAMAFTCFVAWTAQITE